VAINPQTLFDEAKCYLCFEISEDEALELALLARIAGTPVVPVGPVAPNVPTNLLVRLTTTPGNNILDWTASAGTAPTTYQIWLSINGGAFAQVGTVGGGVTTFTHAAAMGASDQWYYEVRACNGVLCSAFTDPAGIFNGFTHTVNTGLADYTFPFLQFVFGDFFVQNQAAMTTVSVPKLRKCTGLFVVNNMPVLTSLVMTSLQTCTLFAANLNTVLTSVSVPALTATSAGGFFFGDCPALQFLSAPALTTVVGDFDGRNNGVMVSIAAPLLATVSGDIFCRFASSLSSTDFTDLTSVTNINFEFSGGFACSFPSLTTVSGSMEFTSSSISSLDANSLTSIGVELNLTSCANLMTLSMTSLTTVGVDILIDCNLLTTTTLTSLQTVSSGTNAVVTQFQITAPNLTSLDLSNLTSIGLASSGASFGLTLSVASLVTMSLPKLSSVAASTSIFCNSGPVNFSAPLLVTTDGDIDFDNNTLLASLSLPAYQTNGELFDLHNCTALTTLSLPSLVSVVDTLRFDGCTALTSVSCPSLTTISNIGLNPFGSANCPLLTSTNFPVLVCADGLVYDLAGCALVAASVNQMLHRGVVSGTTTGTYNLNGGTNAAPSGAGVGDKATLIGLGNTVNTN
jgi:hypothetical protein